MRRLPFFIEVWESDNNAELRLCQKVMAHLYKARITPLPFATTPREVGDVLSSLRKQGLEPAIFVVNTFWAEEMLPQLDALMGETPALFFRREICSQDLFSDVRGQTTAAIRNMTPREATIWSYGKRTADAVAARAAQALLKYFQEGEFSILERANPNPRPLTASDQYTEPRRSLA